MVEAFGSSNIDLFLYSPSKTCCLPNFLFIKEGKALNLILITMWIWYHT
jgi:hypothetical protein